MAMLFTLLAEMVVYESTLLTEFIAKIQSLEERLSFCKIPLAISFNFVKARLVHFIDNTLINFC